MNCRFYATLALAFIFCERVNAIDIVNGGFESTPFTGSFDIVNPGDTTLTGWTVDGAGIVHVGTFWQHASGNHSIELNFNAAGGISQAVTTIPGQRYQLDFDMAGQTNLGPTVKEMQIFWGGSLVSTQTFNISGHSHAAMGWEHRSIILPGATSNSTMLRFFGSGPANGDGGPALDNVSLSLAVPEPGIFPLLPLGLAMLVGQRFRVKSNRRLPRLCQQRDGRRPSCTDFRMRTLGCSGRFIFFTDCYDRINEAPKGAV